MDKPVVMSELVELRFMRVGYEYLGEDEGWHIKEDVPEWAKKGFEEFYAKVNPVPDENGMITQY